MLQEEYFVVESTADSLALAWDQSSGEYGMGVPVAKLEPLELRLRNGVKDPEFMDYHTAPAPVVSKRVGEFLKSMDIYGVQLVPAKIRNPLDPMSETDGYYFVHVWNQISCLDKEKSELELYDDGSIFSIESLVFNNSMDSFELKKRLMFVLAEKISVLFIHKSIKEELDKLQPTGIRFYPATDWYSDIVFD